MSKVFYQVENGVVVGWTVGSDIPNDPTSTSTRMQEWAAAGAGREVITKEEKVAELPAKHIKFENGDVRAMTDQEAKKVDGDKEVEEAQKEQERQTVLAGVQTKLGLSKEEMEVISGKPAKAKSIGADIEVK